MRVYKYTVSRVNMMHLGQKSLHFMAVSYARLRRYLSANAQTMAPVKWNILHHPVGPKRVAFG